MNNPADRADVSLTTMNGLLAEVSPSDVPSGSSPLTWDTDFLIGSVKTRDGFQPVLAAPGANNFNAVTTFSPTNGHDVTFALDSTGDIFIEDVVNSEGRLHLFYNGVAAGSYMKGVTQFEREWLCFSNLETGTDVPRQYAQAFGTDAIRPLTSDGSGANSGSGTYAMTLIENVTGSSGFVTLPVNTSIAAFLAGSNFTTPGTGCGLNFSIFGSLEITAASILVTLAGSTAVVNTVPLTFAGQTTFTPIPSQAFVSADPVVGLAFNSAHDYYFVVYVNNPALLGTAKGFYPTTSATAASAPIAGNQTASSNVSWFVPSGFCSCFNYVILALTGSGPFEFCAELTPTTSSDFAMIVTSDAAVTPPPGWTEPAGGVYTKLLTSTATIAPTFTTLSTATVNWANALALMTTSAVPAQRQSLFITGGIGAESGTFGLAVTAGNTIIVVWSFSNAPATAPTVFDNMGNVYQSIGVTTTPNPTRSAAYIFVAFRCKGGMTTVTVTGGVAGSAAYEYSGLAGSTNYFQSGFFDRVSQVGPGVPPSLSISANNYAIAASATGLTQRPQDEYITGTSGVPGQFQAVTWANIAPNGRSPGNALTIFYNQNTADPNIIIGSVVELSGMQNISGQNPNGTYVINQTGFDFPSGDAGAKRYWFSVSTEQTVFGQTGGPNDENGHYQLTIANVIATTPVPNIDVGGQLAITGAGVPAWDGTWTVSATLNSGQYTITQTSMTTTVASYTFTIVTGVAPTVGELITITGCVNSSIFNVNNVAVVSVGSGVFTISFPPGTADVIAAPEASASAISSGTKFQFDPGLTNLGQAIDVGYTTSIFGNSGGGNIAVAGDIAGGVRQCVCIFKTRNSYLTAPSIPVVFSTAGGNKITASNIPIGPPNVIARILAFTGAGGGYFFWLPEPTIVTGVGQTKTYDATIINDNFTTSVTLDFTDDILLAGLSIDTTGSNLFNLTELGNSVWNVSYASRLMFGGEDNKIQNLTNMSFDGGWVSSSSTVPAGWTPDPTFNVGGSLTVSPIFGNSYTITGDGSLAFNGMLSQPAYQDFYLVPIVKANKSYSARITCRNAGASAGILRLNLISPAFGSTYADTDINVTSMTGTMQQFNLPFMPTAVNPVPTDLKLQLMAAGLNGSIEIDRIEIYPTDQPVLTTEMAASYAFNPESFDGISGVIGLDSQNNQPVYGAFVQYDILYFLKEQSTLSTKDTPRSEPSGWAVKSVSNKIGTAGPLAYDVGEEWCVTACRSGLYLFHTQFIKISQELSLLWEYINWDAQQTIWVKVDTTNRRIMIGVPLKTPNPWLPNDPAATPFSPSHVLMCNFKEVNTGEELGAKSAIHVSFSGSLVSFDTVRKWSIWHIASPGAEFIAREDGTKELMVCNGTGTSKIYTQVPGQYDDDGVGINSLYCTYPFTQREEENQSPLLGAHRKLYNFVDLSITGNGRAVIQALPNILVPRYPYTVPGGALLTVPTDEDFMNGGNVERPLNVTANRCFLQTSMSGVGNWFQLSKVVMSAVKDPFAPVRGL